MYGNKICLKCNSAPGRGDYCVSCSSIHLGSMSPSLYYTVISIIYTKDIDSPF